MSAAFPEVSALPVQRELPDPLRRLDGSRVVTPEDWRAHRRPELAQLLAHYMYGYAPAAPPMAFRRAQSDQPVLNGKATAKALSLCVVEAQGVAPIELLLVLPERRSWAGAGVPRHQLRRQIIERGYAFATFHTCDVKPDRSPTKSCASSRTTDLSLSPWREPPLNAACD